MEKVEWHLGITVVIYFPLDVPSLSVNNQEIRGFYGEMTTITCSYNNGGETKWCKMGLKSCSAPAESRITVNSSIPTVFIVTMSELEMEDSGWYLCVRGSLEMPVRLTVTERPITSERFV